MGILIVDNDEAMRTSVRRLIELAGLPVVGEARDGAEALALAQSLKPAVVVMNGRMPVINRLVATRYCAHSIPTSRSSPTPLIQGSARRCSASVRSPRSQRASPPS